MPRSASYDRDDLINRARELFWCKGWAGTSMKDLEHALNIRPGSFYAAFGSKDELYALALDQYAKDGLSRLENLYQRLGAFDTLKRYPLEVISGKEIPIRACMLSKTLMELQGKDNQLSKKANAHLMRMESKFGNLFLEAQDKGLISLEHASEKLARRYQSDLLGLRLSSERTNIDINALAEEISTDLDHL